MTTTKRRVARTCRAEVIAGAPVPRHIDRSAALTDDLRRIATVAAADGPTIAWRHGS